MHGFQVITEGNREPRATLSQLQWTLFHCSGERSENERLTTEKSLTVPFPLLDAVITMLWILLSFFYLCGTWKRQYGATVMVPLLIIL